MSLEQLPRTVPFSRINVVSSIPSEGGVFGILSAGQYLLVSESWTEGWLLDLINGLEGSEGLTVAFEVCAEDDRQARPSFSGVNCLSGSPNPEPNHKPLPGISLTDR